MIDVCRKITNHPIPVSIKARRSGDCTTLVADSSKARDEMGWEPQYPDLESIITSAWNWHQKYPDGYTEG